MIGDIVLYATPSTPIRGVLVSSAVVLKTSTPTIPGCT